MDVKSEISMRKQRLKAFSSGVLSIFRIECNLGRSRIQILDFLRGTAMLLVLLHHSEIPYNQFILAFHMPLLFFLSGYTASFTEKQTAFFSYVKSRFFRLIVPYLVAEFLYLAAWILSLSTAGFHQSITQALFSILTCLNTEGYTGYMCRLWFFPCMFVSEIYFYFIKKACAGKALRFFCTAIVLFVLSWFNCKVLPFRLPFTLDTALLATAFLVLGYCLAPQITLLLSKKHLLVDGVVFIGMFYILYICIFAKGSTCLMYDNQYGPFLLSVFAAFCGILAFLIGVKWLRAIMEKIPAGKNLVLWYGFHSLATYPVHLAVKIFLLDRFGPNIPWRIMFVSLFFANIPIVNLITRHLPFMLGRFPTHRSENS